MLAITLTSLMLLVVDPEGAQATAAPGSAAAVAAHQDESTALQPPSAAASTGTAEANDADEVARATTEEARRAFEGIQEAVLRNLPRFAVVLAILVLAWLMVRGLRFVVRRLLGQWPRSTAVMALTAVGVWVLAVGISVTIIAGDVRAFLGSVGLLGLAASWALQTPIESFTGWLLNAFRGHYRVGDRIEVGEIFGDVHRIDVLTTTVWEIGSPFRPGFIHAEQPTGRLITFPNNQILTGAVMNYTRDLPYVWDELTVAVANESDLRYAMSVVHRVATDLLGASMREPAEQYQQTLRRAGLDDVVSSEPQVYVSLEDSWTNLYVRYLVDARRRRKLKSELVLSVSEELNRPEHGGKIISVVPRQQLQLIGADGLPRNAAWFREPSDTDRPED